MRWLRCLGFWLAVCLPLTAVGASATRPRLVLPVESIKPGDSFVAGIELSMNRGWHTYWRNGGDSGAATTVRWELPNGFTAGEILWPAPERHEDRIGDTSLITYVYHDMVLLLVPMTVAPNVSPGEVELSATVGWLECEKACIPGKGRVSEKLTVGTQTTASENAASITNALANLPQPAPPDSSSASWDGPANGEERHLTIVWRTSSDAQGTPDFFPLEGKGFQVAPQTETTTQPGQVTFKKVVRLLDGEWPREIGGLLARVDAKGKPLSALEAQFSLGGGGATAASAPPNPGFAVAANVPRLTMVSALGFGFLGGLILNVMPCVLPVIALKILSFVRQSGSRPAEIRKLGLIYSLGVWVSFLVLATIVVVVKASAGVAGWGMQFGSPVFLVALTTLVLLVSLSLFGVFEINLTGRALDSAGDLASREGPVGSFFNGVLAVALATPCTAPFLAPALGYAFTASAGSIFLVFSAVAAGLASPYLILSFQPGWLKFLPRPGPWMERFKIAMGFPMLTAALWLYSVAATRHFGTKGPLWLGIFLVGVSLAAWVWGEFVQRGRSRQGLAMAVSAVLLLGSYGYVLERELHWRAPRAETAQGTAGSSAEELVRGAPVEGNKIVWRPWSPELIELARKNGRPVFVDFTADWCLTCVRNERAAINIAAVREKLIQVNALPVMADYTLYPPPMTRELQRFDRAGVPLVLVYPRDPSRGPMVLPEWLTRDAVLEALDQAAL